MSEIRILNHLKCSRCRWAIRIEGVGLRCSMPFYYKCSNKKEAE